MRCEERGDDACRHQGYEWDEQRKHQPVRGTRGCHQSPGLRSEKWTPEGNRHEADRDAQECDPSGLGMEPVERDLGGYVSADAYQQGDPQRVQRPGHDNADYDEQQRMRKAQPAPHQPAVEGQERRNEAYALVA